VGQGYLIDTNIIPHLFSNRLPDSGKKFVTEIINSNFIISVIVEIEVLTHHEDPEKLPFIEEFISMSVILPLDKEVSKKAIELRRINRKLKLGDSIIAATAIVNQLTLVTNNVKDFLNIKGLKVINPHEL